MKKIALFIILLAIFMTASFSVYANEYKDTVRIGLSYGANASSSATFKSNAEIYVYNTADSTFIGTIPQGVNATVSAYSGTVVSDYFYGGNVVTLKSDDVIYYNNVGYKGSFEVRNNGDLLRIINILNIEDYVASVLGKEMSASWPMEALKAQAVCARNYAFTIGQKHSSYGFDLCATTDCQVYGGIASEAATTRQAAMETAGVTVTYNGRIVPLYYFSCDGGYTENSENVWVSREGYLRGKQDIYENPEYASLYNWTKTFTKSEIEAMLTNNDVYIGELMDITIDEVTENQSVMKLTFVGTLGSKTVTKGQTRSFFGLNSQMFTVEKVYDSYIEADNTEESYYVLGSDGVVLVEKPESYLTSEGVKYFEYEPEVNNTIPYDRYVIHGHGWGHRIGMSQWGAYSMAKLGFTYKDILNFYFTDIIISEQNYVTEPTETVVPNYTQGSETGI